MKAADSRPAHETFVAEMLHSLAQPLTALQCGLELSLYQDKTVADFRNRMEVLLGIAQSLRERLVAMRASQDAADGARAASDGWREPAAGTARKSSSIPRNF
ncbi:MAG TPA: hypothetical protein VE779_10085 [Candidatus Angelobacter sp.]|nr:hypothetical protein [Candidatus Angelobacter sp.]